MRFIISSFNVYRILYMEILGKELSKKIKKNISVSDTYVKNYEL